MLQQRCLVSYNPTYMPRTSGWSVTAVEPENICPHAIILATVPCLNHFLFIVRQVKNYQIVSCFIKLLSHMILCSSVFRKIIKTLSARWPICWLPGLLHVMSSNNLLATILSVLSFLFINKISAAITSLNSMTLLLTRYLHTFSISTGYHFLA